MEAVATAVEEIQRTEQAEKHVSQQLAEGLERAMRYRLNGLGDPASAGASVYGLLGFVRSHASTCDWP